MTVDPRSGYAPSACVSQENQVAMPLSMPELIHAVSTLVQDQVRPTIGILRRRIEELSNRTDFTGLFTTKRERVSEF